MVESMFMYPHEHMSLADPKMFEALFSLPINKLSPVSR